MRPPGPIRPQSEWTSSFLPTLPVIVKNNLFLKKNHALKSKYKTVIVNK